MLSTVAAGRSHGRRDPYAGWRAVTREDCVKVSEAKAAARQWMRQEGKEIPGFAGAFFHGSVNWLPDDAGMPLASDIDVMVVLDDAAPRRRPGKFHYRDVLLEVSYLPREQVESPEQILGRYDLAGSFHVPSVIVDPTGHLTRLQATVAGEYARRVWVHRRCQDASERIARNLRALVDAPTFPDQVTAWLFAAGVATHILLVAGLRNPTVRRRYLAARELLAEYGHPDCYSSLLELLGAARMSQRRAEAYLAELAGAFDAASVAIRTPFPFAADISDVGRPIAIAGSRELIARGDHREALFWMLATASRCQQVFQRDASEIVATFEPGFRALLADLGIASSAVHQRAARVEAALPRIWSVAEAIMAANPRIEA
jgi:hypothetical protein